MDRWQEIGLRAIGKEINYTYLSKEIPNFISSELTNITKIQNEFYNEILFPNYDDFDDFGSLLKKGSNSTFTAKLDYEIPFGSKVLELGCGTGQLSLFLSRFNRTIYGADISEGSLLLGEKFRKDHNRNNVFFCKADVFDLPFKKNYFNVIISNGVLHHTKDAKLAFNKLIEFLKPGGYIIIGLYHYYGRLLTKLKQSIFPMLGKKAKYFDSTLRNRMNRERSFAWERDQFYNPHETTHTLREALKWLEHSGLQYVNSIPFSFDETQGLFSIKDLPRRKELFIREAMLAFDLQQMKEGGFFIFVAKKAT